MGRPRLHLTLSLADERRLKELWKTTWDQPLQEPQAQRRLQAKLVAGDFRAAGQMSRWLEQAGTHALPDRAHVIPLPAYSPELDPIEKLWDALKDGPCNRLFHSMEELWQALCVELEPFDQPERVHQLLGSGPILAPANASST